MTMLDLITLSLSLPFRREASTVLLLSTTIPDFFCVWCGDKFWKRSQKSLEASFSFLAQTLAYLLPWRDHAFSGRHVWVVSGSNAFGPSIATFSPESQKNIIHAFVSWPRLLAVIVFNPYCVMWRYFLGGPWTWFQGLWVLHVAVRTRKINFFVNVLWLLSSRNLW